MSAETIDKLIWTLIYGGLISVAIGIAAQRGDAAAAGWVLVSGGAIASIVGAVLIYVRSRMKEPQ
jgi:hypothetical protein